MSQSRRAVVAIFIYSISLGASWLLTARRPVAVPPRVRGGPSHVRLRAAEDDADANAAPDPMAVQRELRELLRDLPAVPPGDGEEEGGGDSNEDGLDAGDAPLPAHLPFATVRELEAFLASRARESAGRTRLNATARAALAADEDDPFSVRLDAAAYLRAARWVTPDGLSRRAQEEAELARLVAAATVRAEAGGGGGDGDDWQRWSSPSWDPPDAAELLAGINPTVWAATSAVPPPLSPPSPPLAEGERNSSGTADLEAVLDVPRLRALWAEAQARLAAADEPGSAAAAARDAQDAALFAGEAGFRNLSRAFRDALTDPDPALADAAWVERHGRAYRARRDAALRELEEGAAELERDLARAAGDPTRPRCGRCGCLLGRAEVRENEGRRRKICQACHAEEIEATSPRPDWTD